MAETTELTRSEGLAPSADSPLPDVSFEERYPARSELAAPGAKLPDNTYGPAPTPGPLDAVDPMADTSGLAASLARATERRMGNDAFAIAEADQYRIEDRERARKAYDATGVGPDATPKWDADAESARYSTSPIAKFGSLGSVVGMLASAFTHHPMQNAMNASAAAMNAIGEHDAEGYQRAHAAWKENTDLVFKRADLEQKRFNDAIRLMDTDANIAAAKLRENAVMEGDEKALAMLNAGMIPELVKYKGDQATAIEKLIKARDDIERTGWADAYTKPMVKEAQEQYKNDPEKLAGAMMHIAQMKGFLKDDDIDRQALGNWMAKRLKENNFEAIPFEEVTAKIMELAAARKAPTSLNAVEAKAVQSRTQQLIGEGMEPGAASIQAVNEIDKRRSVGRGGGPNELRDRTQQYETDPNSPTHGDHKASYDRAAKEIKQANRGVLTEGQQQKIAEKERTIESITNQIDRALQIIKQAQAEGDSVTGARGAYGRVKEFALGGGTYQAEFQELIKTIQKESKPIISGTTRLTKDDQKDLDIIVPGLGFLKNQDQVYTGLQRFRQILNKADLLEHDEGPKKGDVEDGYRFKGGDPKDRNSWEPVK